MDAGAHARVRRHGVRHGHDPGGVLLGPGAGQLLVREDGRPAPRHAEGLRAPRGGDRGLRVPHARPPGGAERRLRGDRTAVGDRLLRDQRRALRPVLPGAPRARDAHGRDAPRGRALLRPGRRPAGAGHRTPLRREHLRGRRGCVPRRVPAHPPPRGPGDRLGRGSREPPRGGGRVGARDAGGTRGVEGGGVRTREPRPFGPGARRARRLPRCSAPRALGRRHLRILCAGAGGAVDALARLLPRQLDARLQHDPHGLPPRHRPGERAGGPLDRPTARAARGARHPRGARRRLGGARDPGA